MNAPLLPDLPSSLNEFVQELYPDPILARRALLAPWPGEFRSAYDERALWQSTNEPQQSQLLTSRGSTAIVAIHPDPFFRNRPETQDALPPDKGKAPKTVAEAKNIRRQSFERILRQERELFQSPQQPYFLSEGTHGTLRSPYPELSDGEYWLYVILYGSEQAARRELEGCIVPSLGNKTTLEFLRSTQRPGAWSQLRRIFVPAANKTAHATAWNAQTEVLFPVYL